MNIHFGFSYTGLIFLLMLMIPNFVWSKNKPKDYDIYVKNENKVLLLFERIGDIEIVAQSIDDLCNKMDKDGYTLVAYQFCANNEKVMLTFKKGLKKSLM